VGLGIGLLAKGPIAVVLSLVPIFAWVVISRNFSAVWNGLPWIRGGLITLCIALPWYLLAEIRTPGFLDYFIIGEHLNRFLVPGWQGDLYGSAHKFPRGTIWLFLMIDLLPWILLLPVFYVTRRLRSDKVNAAVEDRPWSIYLWLWALTPAVFFTFAGNILWPYVLPGFPAMAILASTWLERDSKPHVVDGLLAAGLVTTVILFYAYLIDLKNTGFDRERSQKALVTDYLSRRQFEEPLVYVGARQFSADFYSKRQVQYLPDIAFLAQRIENITGYVAIPNTLVPSLPQSLVNTLQLVNVHGRYTLYVFKNTGGS
jgi:4-amino-4-deoxy-L-arabinose transferase-like glycosyltransferase